jgi:hypothetical protein
VIDMEMLDAIETTYVLDDRRKMLLALAREAVVEYVTLRDELEAMGRMIPGRYEGTPRLNPLVGAVAQARAAAIRAVRSLDLDNARRRSAATGAANDPANLIDH